jgi:hypothetical protein
MCKLNWLLRISKQGIALVVELQLSGGVVHNCLDDKQQAERLLF